MSSAMPLRTRLREEGDQRRRDMHGYRFIDGSCWWTKPSWRRPVVYATGAAELRRIAAMCKAVASDGQIARDVTKATLASKEPVRTAFRMHALAVLPKRGGLNSWVAESRMTFRGLRSGGSGGMTVTVSKGGHDLDGLDGGIVVHPYYGHGPWTSQGVPPESISEPIRSEGGNVLEAACLFALEHAAERIARA